MGHWEDKIMNVYYEVERLGLKEEFNKKLTEVRKSPKHKHLETRDCYEIALSEVKKSPSKDVIRDIIKNTPNDLELGSKIRKLYWDKEI